MACNRLFTTSGFHGAFFQLRSMRLLPSFYELDKIIINNNTTLVLKVCK